MARSTEEEIVFRMEGFVPRHRDPLAAVRGVIASTIAGLFFAVVTLTALGMGGNRDWVWAPVGVMIGVLSIVVAAGAVTRSGFEVIPAERKPLLAVVGCFLLFLLFALFQMSTVAPLTASAVYYEAAARLLGQAHAPVPALAVDAARNSLIKCLTCGAIFLAARAMCRDRARARMLLYFFIGSGVVVFAYGLLMKVTTNSCYLGSYLKKVGVYAPGSDSCVMSGTFVNSNSFGCYCGMALVAAMAMLFAERRRAGPQPYGYGERDEDSWLAALTMHRLVMLAACLVMLGGLMFSASRGGVAATVGTAGLLVLLMLRGLWRARPDVARYTLIGLALFAVVVLGIAGNAIVNKAVSGGDSTARIEIWTGCWRAIRASPWLGWGLGSYPDIYTIFQPENLTAPNDVAHSTPLEVMVELGIPMALVAYAIVLIPLGVALLGTLNRSPAHRYLPAAAFAVVLVPVLHSMIDFSLQMPAIGFVVSAMLGMGWAQAFGRREAAEMPLRGEPA
mgnify:CR=1 FL=1